MIRNFHPARDQGYWHSCNDDKESYGNELGIGVIQREDLDIRPKVHYAMHYLAKDRQYLRVKPAGAWCFRTGRIRGRGAAALKHSY